MTYATGTATDQHDLLGDFRSFLTSNGWTEDSYVADGLGFRFHAHNGSNYVNMRSREASEDFGLSEHKTDAICINMGTGYSGASNWYSQPGASTVTGHIYSQTITLIDATEYHFFIQSDNAAMAVKSSNGIWNFICFGLTTESEQFHSGSFPQTWPFFSDPYYLINTANDATATLVDHNGTWGKTIFSGYDFSNNNTTKETPNTFEILNSIDSFSGDRILIPPLFLLDAGSSLYYTAGTTTDDFCLYNGSNDEQGREITIGSNTYKLFQSGGSFFPSGFTLGYAFKK